MSLATQTLWQVKTQENAGRIQLLRKDVSKDFILALIAAMALPAVLAMWWNITP